MKRVFCIMMAALMAFASCQRAVPEQREVEVTFAVDIPQQVYTRAIADGTSAVDLHFRVYRVTGGVVECVTNLGQDIPNAFVDLHTMVTTRLVRNETYHFVFWAQSAAAASVFDISQLDSSQPTVTVNYAATANSNESVDAFYVTHMNYVAVDDMNINEVLRRPFAQINFGSVEGDLADAAIAGIDITTTSMTILDVYTKLYMFSGDVSDPVDVTFAPAPMPSESLVVENVRYKWLSMDYVLVPEDKTATDVTLILCNGTRPLNSIMVSNIPLQRNWRTNILGRLLTTNTGFIISIDPAFIDEYNVGYVAE